MGITSLQVCMDSSDWLQGTISEDGAGMDSSPISTTPTGNGEPDNLDSIDGINLSRPLIERRLRPQQEQSLKCPRCESSHTKFCYYNNYSLSQPRYFCKTCRRYWTKGGTLRNIPVGGGCRKNTKKTSSKKSSAHAPPSPPPTAAAAAAMIPHHTHALPIVCYDNNNHTNSTDLQLAFPEQLQFSGMFNNAGAGAATNGNGNPNFPIEFMDSKYEALILGGNQEFDQGFGAAGGSSSGEFSGNAGNSYFNGGFCSPLGFSALEHGNSSGTAGVFDNCGRLLQPYDHHHHHHHQMMDVKPAAKMLAIEWNDNHHSDPGYGFGSWTGLMNNGYGSSAANPLV